MKKLVATKIKTRKLMVPAIVYNYWTNNLAEFDGWKELEMGSVDVFTGEDLPVYNKNIQAKIHFSLDYFCTNGVS